MKPIENKQPFENELIDHIRENLIEHEETYRPGAWEDFNKPEKKKRSFFWIEFIGAAAAILLIAFISFLVMNKTSEKPVQQLVNTKKQIEPKENEQTEKAGKLKEEGERKTEVFTEKGFVTSKHIADSYHSIKEKNLILNNDSTSLKNQAFKSEKEYQAILAPKNNDLFALLKNERNEITVRIEDIILTPKTFKQAEIKDQEKDNFIEILEKESKKNQLAKRKNSGKFTFGIMAAPSFGSSRKLNMGYGVNVDYSFSDKFSISSGITYNQMGGAKNIESTNDILSVNKSALLSKDESLKTLKYFEEIVAGVDIPLEVKYSFSKSIYANVGVSALAVINQSRNNTYVEQKVVQKVNISVNGDQEPSASLINRQVTEPVKINNYSFLGFYNFSFGYKKKILNKNSIALEPFIKLPIKEFNAENLKLMGTGIKLKLDF